jgi:HlyD family secretion protein
MRARGVAFALLFAACGRAEDGAGYSGTVEFPDVRVGSLVGGRVERVLVREGERAAAGDALVALDPREWRSALEEARALAEATARELDLLRAGPRAEEIAAAEAEAKRLELLWSVLAQGPRPEEVEAARERVNEARAALVEAEARFERERQLRSSGSSSQERVDEAHAAREIARARAAAAEQQLQLLEKGLRPEEVEAARQAHVAQAERVRALRAGARPEEIAAKQATLEAARARIAVAESKLDELTIRAPADCFVQTLDVRPGDLIAPGAPVAVLLLAEEPWVTVYVPEGELASVRVGGGARVLPDGHPPLQGRVAWVSRVAEFTPRNVQTRGERVTQVFAVKVVVEGDVGRLKDGMWADVALE